MALTVVPFDFLNNFEDDEKKESKCLHSNYISLTTKHSLGALKLLENILVLITYEGFDRSFSKMYFNENDILLIKDHSMALYLLFTSQKDVDLFSFDATNLNSDETNNLYSPFSFLNFHILMALLFSYSYHYETNKYIDNNSQIIYAAIRTRINEDLERKKTGDLGLVNIEEEEDAENNKEKESGWIDEVVLTKLLLNDKKKEEKKLEKSNNNKIVSIFSKYKFSLKEMLLISLGNFSPPPPDMLVFCTILNNILMPLFEEDTVRFKFYIYIYIYFLFYFNLF
jgi:hypothetical protein